MEKQLGKNTLLYIDTVTAITAATGTTANYKLAGCLTDTGFTFTRDELTTTRTKCDGDDPAAEPGEKSWSFSGSGVQAEFTEAEEDDYMTEAQLLALANAGTKAWFKVANTETGKVRESVGWINSFTESDPAEGEGTFDIDITGHSKLSVDTVA